MKMKGLLIFAIFLSLKTSLAQSPINSENDTLSLDDELELLLLEEEEDLEFYKLREVEEAPIEEMIFKVKPEWIPRFLPECGEKGMTKEELKECNERVMLEFIYKNLEYPKEAIDRAIEGTVIAQFVLEKDMTVQNIKILKDIGGGCGDEAARLINKLNERAMRYKWRPVSSRGKPMKVQFTLPIRFQLP